MYEKIIEWQDKENTGAKGWIIFDNIMNGVAGGGIFMASDATEQEVKDLARTMKYKGAMQNPIFGGAKAGIKFNPNDEQAENVLKRFLIDNKSVIQNTWVTASDLNTSNDFIHSVLQDLGLGSGFFALGEFISKLEGIKNQSFNLIDKISQKVDSFAALSECATGYGVACSINWLNKKKSPKIIIQGFGAVGSSLAYFLNKYNIGKVVGIIEKDCCISCDNGIDLNQVFANYNITDKKSTNSRLYNILNSMESLENHKFLLRESNDNKSAEDFLCDFITLQKANVFSPCATRYSITSKVLETLKDYTFQTENSIQNNWIICGANNAFETDNLVNHFLNNDIYTIPSWVSNSGNATLFVESLKIDTISDGADWSEIVLNKIRNKIELFLLEAMENCSNNNSMLYFSCYLLAEKLIKNHVPALRNSLK